jgi:D-aminopeptidase
MRVLISADAEGVTGVTTTDELLFGKPYWEGMRGMLYGDDNADVAGRYSRIRRSWSAWPRSRRK